MTYHGYYDAVKCIALAELHRLDDGTFSAVDRHTLSVVIFTEEQAFWNKYGCLPKKYLHDYHKQGAV